MQICAMRQSSSTVSESGGESGVHLFTSRRRHRRYFGKRGKALPAQTCKNIPAKFREPPSKCSAAHPENALWQNISASHSQNLAWQAFFYTTLYKLAYHIRGLPHMTSGRVLHPLSRSRLSTFLSISLLACTEMCNPACRSRLLAPSGSGVRVHAT